MQKIQFYKVIGFTLAEVLITLVIIGIVAAMTIPNLVNAFQDMQYKTAYKKVYAASQQAYDNANRQELMVPNVNGDYDSFNNNFLTFMDQFKVVKKCISGDGNQCWDSSGEKYVTVAPWNSSYSFIDSSGVAYSTYYAAANNNEREFLVDTNGLKKPNQYGKDRFAFKVFSVNPSHEQLNIPVKVAPLPDNNNRTCISANKCATEQNYFGTSWLYN